MSSNIQLFNFKDNNIRTVLIDNVVWFIASDICKVLEISNTSQAMTRLEEEDKLIYTLYISGQNRSVSLVNESGLYSLILTSNKKEAKAFKKWVTSEVLPSIRKHGAYMDSNTIEKALTNPDFLIQLATNLKQEKEKRLKAEQELNNAKPKVAFANALEISETSILVNELAKLLKQKGIDIGGRRLFEWLRNNGYILKNNDVSQKAMELGLFEKKTTVIQTNNKTKAVFTPKVTSKGIVYFINKFLNKNLNGENHETNF